MNPERPLLPAGAMWSDYLALRLVPDGRLLAVVPLLFGWARLMIGPAGEGTWDDGW